MLLGKNRLVDALSKAARASAADETLLAAQRSGQTTLRFSGGRIHQNFHEEDLTVWVKVAARGRVGVATTSSVRHEAIMKAVDSAMDITHLPGKQTAPAFSTSPPKEPTAQVATYFPATIQKPLTEIVKTIRRLSALTQKRGATLAGSFVVGESEQAVVGSRDLVQYQPVTIGGLRLVVTQGRASGFAAQAFRDIGQWDPEGLLKRAWDFCRMNRDPKAIPLGRYDVLLEPEAVSEIVEWLSYIGFGAKQVHERTSFLTARMGDRITAPEISIHDDGTDPAGLAFPFDYEGVPKRRVNLIHRGVAESLVYDSHYARLYHTRSTGHALPYDDFEGPIAQNLFVAAGDTSHSDLLKRMDRGLWITRFHYVNGLLKTQQALMTGLTRDGTFLVRDGKVVEAVKNLRFTEPILEAFSRVTGVSRERRRVSDPAQGFFSVVTPALLLRRFTFTGQTR